MQRQLKCVIHNKQMKSKMLFTMLSLISPLLVVGQTTIISGRVIDARHNPVSYANIYIVNSVEGTSSDDDGNFRFETSSTGVKQLVVSMIGYEDYLLEEDMTKMHALTIILKEIPLHLDEVVVQVGSFIIKGTSSIENKGSVDVATTAGSEGDLFKALTLLPGAQATGTDGRLLIRGGNSSESQTYIDDMHVLSPYGATSPHQQARSRYSPFFFSGVNFSMGGFSSEYSQSLSSVLPLYTRDEAKESKVGLSLMNVSVGGGGTKAWKKASLSFNSDYGNMDSYNRLFYPEQNNSWKEPVRFWSLQKQFRYSPKENTHFKTFFTFDRTIFNQIQTPSYGENREMDFAENNLYLNSTFRTRGRTGMKYFAGIAYARNRRHIAGAQLPDDLLKEQESELHVKAKAGKRFTDLYKLEFGVESVVKQYRMDYQSNNRFTPELKHHITGLYLSNDFNILDNLLLNASVRGEKTSLNDDFALLPRIAVSYKLSDFVFSGVAGRYQQLSDKEYLAYNPTLSNVRNLQYQAGIYYQKKQKIFRVEAYYKDYEKLPVMSDQQHYLSEGYGYSRGIDLFFNDQLLLNHWDYTVSYTFNDSRRKYLHYPTLVQPHYVTRHNASVSIRYTNLEVLRSMISISQRYASGRPYHNPNGELYMSGRTPELYTTDISLTILAHRKLIIYLSASNIFHRLNIYGYDYNTQPNREGIYERKSIMLAQPQNFYVGFFLTLGRNVAYEATHF